MTTDARSVVIVGTGAAGYAVAEGLQSSGFTGGVTLLGEETEEPYDRPPLSKEILSGAWELPRAALIAAKRVAPMNPTIVTGVRAASVDVAGHRLELSDGRSIAYDALVVATGVTPRRLVHPDLPNIHVLRELRHSLALRSQLMEGNKRLLVVGAGFLGLEVAATSRKFDTDVTVVEPIPGPPLASRVGTEAATKLLHTHEANGVRIHTGIGVSDIASSDGQAVTATLSDGTTVDADVVLIAVGSVPTTDWLEGSGLPVQNGLMCDQFCSAGSDVWGAGDVASWEHVGYQRRLRLEHRTNAQEQGHAVAHNIVGPPEPFVPIPYFWTDHYDVRIQLSGVIPEGADTAIVEGDPSEDKFVQTFSEGGRVMAVLAWKAPRLMAEYRKQLMAEPPT